MPNTGYLFVQFFYNLALGLWVGGGVALGALVAPVIFRRVGSRLEAGELFGGILARFSFVRIGSLLVAVAAAAIKFMVWERHAAGTSAAIWLGVRWAALALMAGILLYELMYLRPAMEKRRSSMREGEEGRERAEFGRLHKRAEALMKGGLLCALAALLAN